MAVPQTRYAGGPDAFVAFQTVGEGPLDLVFIDHWMTNLEVMWESPRFTTFYDESAAIGRRYRRLDEVGTPFCVTIDGETLTQDTVTVRHRDTMQQDRVKLSELSTFLTQSIRAWKRPERAPAARG